MHFPYGLSHHLMSVTSHSLNFPQDCILPSGPGSEMEDGGVQLSEVCCICFNKVRDDRHQGLTNHLKFISYQFKTNYLTSMHRTAQLCGNDCRAHTCLYYCFQVLIYIARMQKPQSDVWNFLLTLAFVSQAPVCVFSYLTLMAMKRTYSLHESECTEPTQIKNFNFSRQFQTALRVFCIEYQL